MIGETGVNVTELAMKVLRIVQEFVKVNNLAVLVQHYKLSHVF